MIKTLTVKKLGQDKQKIEQLIMREQKLLMDTQAHILRLQGALNYINDNIKEVDDDRKGSDNEG